MTDREATAKAYAEVVNGRRSIRGYKRDPVPKVLIREILALAMRSPSSLNTQPWNFYVVTGEPLERIRAENTRRNLERIPSTREFRGMENYEGVHRERDRKRKRLNSSHYCASRMQSFA